MGVGGSGDAVTAGKPIRGGLSQASAKKNSLAAKICSCPPSPSHYRERNPVGPGNGFIRAQWVGSQWTGAVAGVRQEGWGCGCVARHFGTSGIYL